MNTKHTPGPWAVDGHNLTAIIHNQGSETWPQWKHVCDCNYGYADPERHFEENRANAKLIAAAPDLLKALKELIPLAEDGYALHRKNASHQEFLNDDRECIEFAKEAIKKATE